MSDSPVGGGVTGPDPRTTSVIAAFPATGKTFVAERDLRFLDSDSSRFPRGSCWPENYYIAHVKAVVAADRSILVSTHAEVRAALVGAGIPFTLVYPEPTLRDEYRARMQERGSLDVLIRRVIDELWDDALAECAAQTGCDHIVLKTGQYLGDVLPDWLARGLDGEEK